jgi:hypothetical protein
LPQRERRLLRAVFGATFALRVHQSNGRLVAELLPDPGLRAVSFASQQAHVVLCRG